MAISFTRYVDITSGVGAGTTVPRRDLILRIFTTNELLPTNAILEFTDAAQVGEYFGTDSEEYRRAVFYFSFISKNITQPQRISYARWADVATAPQIYGSTSVTQALATWTAISAGSFGLTIGGVVNTFTGLDFSGAASLAAVATILQTAIRTKTGTMWTAATVTYNAVRGSFDFEGGSTGANTISVQQGVGGTPIGNIMGWLQEDAIISNGVAAQSITDILTSSTGISNNFGSFLFMPALTIEQITDAAEWNYDQNVMFMYLVPVSVANIASYFTALADFGGTGVTISMNADEYPEQFPAMILAATDYNAVNAVQNYMFQQTAGLTPSVTTDSLANTADTARTNYYGRTQDAGTFIDFYQRGVLMGLATSPLDMNTYANEMWFKDAAGAAIMTLLLALPEIAANAQGRGQILTTLQGVINQALNNGTISLNKPLTDAQKLYITQITGDNTAWYQVQNNGYWLDCVIVLDGSEYKAVYTLVYSKNDVIRKVEGSQILI